MTRIIFVNRYFAPDHSATSQILTDLATDLSARGRDVHVITGDETYGGDARLSSFECIAGVHVHRVSSGGLGRTSLTRRAADYLVLYAAMYGAAKKLLRPGDILVAKTDPPLLSIPMSRAAKQQRARLVNWLQDLYPEVAGALNVPMAKGGLGRALARLRDRSLQAADTNVVIGERMGERLLARGIPPSRVTMIPNWANDAEIEPMVPHDNILRAAWGLTDKFVLGYSGNLGRAHECETLLAAAGLLHGRPDIAFLFIGGGHHVEQLRAQAAMRGLSDRFHFRPYQDRRQLKLSLGVADAHWLSLRPELEGLIVPSKFYGIAAAGRPLISVTSPSGEIARLVTRFACGFVAAPGDAAQLAKHILNLADDPVERMAMGARARQMLLSHYTKRHALAQWSALFETLLSRRPTREHDQVGDG
ncbi:MAG: bme8 [Hyphomicrobiales bacterium]|nr:bme8 [Hyphomicrobiales bacterium]